MNTTDLVGTWQILGTVTPLFEQWTRFPIGTISASSLIRLHFSDASNFTKIGSFGYLRVIYQVPYLYSSRWQRVYPHPQPSILDLRTPDELLTQSDPIPRYFDLMKRNKYHNPKINVKDTQWALTLEALET